ncbi:hypothetical protein AB0L63_24605 [Nocardia sp. NPDC051990]|uniref:hypothetical protein n=1 Tax=Nocardia sp. NPDC051990 TaxID=3155285 RepID=UPI00341E4518
MEVSINKARGQLTLVHRDPAGGQAFRRFPVDNATVLGMLPGAVAFAIYDAP